MDNQGFQPLGNQTGGTAPGQTGSMGSAGQPGQGAMGGMNGAGAYQAQTALNGQFGFGNNGQAPMATGQMPAGQVPTARLIPVAPQNNSSKNTIMLVLLIVAGLVAVTFIGLFIWMFSQWDSAQSDVNSQINAAVAEAVNNNTEELENQFIEREKQPYQTFAGPVDYGELSFEYPKTWSVYEAKDATSGGDYEAYLNPGKVYPVSSSTINALRVLIKDQSYDDFLRNYESYVKNGKLSVSVRLINGENANVYTGEMPNSNLQGIATVFKIRDKAAVIQTDAMIFEEDFQRVLDTVRFNQ